MEIVPAYLQRQARMIGAVIVICDYYLARRKRVHLAWDPTSDDHTEDIELVHLFRWTLEKGRNHILVIPGTRHRPQPAYWCTLLPNLAPGGIP